MASATRPSCRVLTGGGFSRRLLCSTRVGSSNLRCRPPSRDVHCTAIRRGQSTFDGLVESRIVTPWIDALRDRDALASAPKQKIERDLSPKTMRDSYHRVVLPLAQDKWLTDTYLNSSGHIRLGAIFMDLDALAGIIAYKHTGEGVTVVTAACDRISLERNLTEICDLEYSGAVTYATGRSSMEITCKVARAPPQGQTSRDEDLLLKCTFTMVSLDPETKKATDIPALRLESEQDKEIFSLGEARSEAKKALKKRNLLAAPPNSDESALLHTIWLRQLAYHDPNNPLRRPANVHHMSSTVLSTSAIMQPQYRNRHNFIIFGGYLMKSTFELAFCCAANFAHTRPRFVSLDPSTFLNPVPVGGVLYLTARVVHTDPPVVSDDEAIGSAGSGKGGQQANGPLATGIASASGGDAASSSPPRSVNEDSSDESGGDSGKGAAKQTRVQVRVDGKVRDLEHGTVKPTGQFNYTFIVDRDIRILPQTYTDAMVYIDAKRRAATVRAEQEMEGSRGEGEGSRARVTE